MSNINFKSLQKMHERLLEREQEISVETQQDFTKEINEFIKQGKKGGESISSSWEREELLAILRYWANYIYSIEGKFPNIDLVPSTAANKRGLTSFYVSVLGIIFLFVIVIVFFPGILLSTLATEPSSTPTPTFLPSATQPSLTPTPTLLPFVSATVKQASYCHNGPSENYLIAKPITANTIVSVLAKNSDSGDWFLVDSSAIDRCWIKASNLDYRFDLESLLDVTTAFTRSATTCRTGPGTLYKEQTYIPKDFIIVINGINSPGDWLLVTPQDSTVQCWVNAILFSNIDLSVIPLVDTPDPPTAIPVITATARHSNNSNSAPTDSLPVSPTTIPPTPTLCWPPGHCK